MSEFTTISRGRLEATIDAVGAQLTSLALDGNEYLWQADPRWWNKHAPILFPIVGSLRGDGAVSSRGPVHLGRHGFARDLDHRLLGVGDDGRTASFELVDTAWTRARYPFSFRLVMTYALSGPTSLTQTFAVENTGSVDLPFSIGGHPAFNVPSPGTRDERFEDYRLEFTEPLTAVAPMIAEGGLLSYDHARTVVDHDRTLPLRHELFAHDAIMLERVPGRELRLRSAKSGHGIGISFPGFDYIGIWSAAGDAPFVALEPWTGHATLTAEDDVLEHKRGITELAPGARSERSFTVTLF